MRRVLILLIWITTLASVQGQPKRLHVLFVGNSLTYQNSLPGIVQQIARADGVVLTYKMIALPDYALEDHWNDGDALREIASDKYNFVVVQQGPSSQTEGFNLLRDYGIKFKQLGKEHHAQLVFYMVWPSKMRSSDFPGVYNTYKTVAQQTNSIFSPAGQAWLALWKDNPEFSLYGPDNVHPNSNGSLLAALVLYGSLSGKDDFSFLSAKQLEEIHLTGSELKLLTQAAHKTLVAENKATR